MKKIFILLICLKIVWISSGQRSNSTELPNALLWEISGKNLESSSYLYGTIHMIGKKDFLITDDMKEALKACDNITFEINMEDMMDISKMMPLMMRAFMNNDTTLADLLSAEEYKLVQDHFNKIGLPLMLLERIKPMFLSALTSEDLMSFDPQGGDVQGNVVSYEIELMNLAKGQEKTIGGLETAEFQMSMFDSIPYKVQAQMLVESITATNKDNDEFEKMVDLYKKQDINGMQDLMKEDENGIGKYEELLLINRNKNWIPVMASSMKKESTFFAVGAGHLGGEEGVVRLLQKEGYTLRPIIKEE